MRTLGVIPARGGSKGVPRKNIRELGGRPLLAWTIEAALAAEGLDRVVVSTEDEEIAEVARLWGADVPFRRPTEHATDVAPAIPNVVHALEATEASERQDPGSRPYDAIMMLQPTTPFRLPRDIDAAVDLLERTGADSVISVVDVGAHHPARMKYLEGDRLVDPPFAEAYENQNRQELTPMYLRNGMIYLTRRAVLLGGSFKGEDCRGLVIPEDRSVNIDVERDFLQAQWLLDAELVELGP